MNNNLQKFKLVKRRAQTNPDIPSDTKDRELKSHLDRFHDFKSLSVTDFSSFAWCDFNNTSRRKKTNTSNENWF